MQDTESRQERAILAAVSCGGMLRPGDVTRCGGSRAALARLKDRGEVERVETNGGVLLGFRKPGADMRPDGGTAVEIAARHPNAVLCLMSALRHHDMTDDLAQPWVAAVPAGSNHKATLHGVRLIHWGDPRLFVIGVDTVSLADIGVRVTSPARTVADMFRPRHRQELSEKTEALASLHRRWGDGAVSEACAMAATLGWGNEIMAAAAAVKEASRWSVTPRR